MIAHARFVMTPFWLTIWACVLAVGWLLPNHYRPWLSFHTDAWVALIFSLASLAVILRVRGPMMWHHITVLVALLPCIVWAQYAFGLVPMIGNAWISTVYLLGFLLALLTGARWEANNPGQFVDGLFLAIGAAAVLSVGLQLYVWLQLDGLGLWAMGGNIERPHANFGQPNQLGTFLLWGVLAATWGLIRKRISVGTALLMAAYILFGVALTASRTAWVGVALLVAASWVWRGLWHDSRLPWVVTGLALYFVICIVVLGWLQHASQGGMQTDISDITRMSGETRPLAWAIFVDAIWQRPFFGYGWNQSGLAQMTVAAEHPPLHSFFSYSHNLFLDLVLWCGIPLGFLISMALLWWLWGKLRAVRSVENAILLLFLIVVANHAMLELPLYFAYFLLPVGMVMGVLNVRLGTQVVMHTSRWVLFVLWLAGVSLLALIIRDYSRIEPSYRILRMEWDNFSMSMPHGPPDVLLLTQWHDYIRYARFEPKAGLTVDELDWMRNVTGLFPNIIFFNKLATALALNQRPDEAHLWLKKMCKVAPEAQCLAVKKDWARQALKSPEIAAIPWPIETDK